MRARCWIPLAVFSVLLLAAGQAATTITISGRVAQAGVKRFGLNLGALNYFDSGQIMKQLVFRNPGFEPQIYQSIIHVALGTATGCVDDITTTSGAPPFTAWPSGFWNGGAFEVIWGAAKGRTGTIASSTAPAGGRGTTYAFTTSGAAPAAGDYIVLRKADTGNPTAGWTATTTGGAAIAGETIDLAGDAQGRQAVRLTATGAGQTAAIAAVFEASPLGSFLQLNGNFRLSFKAKGAGGANQMAVVFGRTSALVNQTITVPATWTTYNLDFSATENGSATGICQLRISTSGQSAVLLDEVNLVQTNSDPANPTAFRDPVVAALRLYRPGLLRYSHVRGQLGDTLDNQIAAPFARQRSGFTTNASTSNDLDHGLHEFLELCEAIGAEPWYVTPLTLSTTEAANLIEYLAGPATSPYGARRAARGHRAPWTEVFAKIHLEFGNEAWNTGAFSGGTISNPTAYGNRGSEIYGVMRSSPFFSTAKFDLVLGSRAEDPGMTASIHAASAHHDSVCVGPYIGWNVDRFANNEELFGPLFAEPEMLSATGYLRQDYTSLQASGRPAPLAIYETNMHTSRGAISQAVLDSFIPSLGAGLALADHMLLMLRELGAKNQMLYALTEYANARDDGKTMRLFGVVRDMGVTDRKRPQFLALQLANEAVAGDLVQTTHSGDNPTWNQPVSNSIRTPFNGAHYLQSFAFADGSSKALIVLNLHRTDALNVNFAGTDAPFGSVTLRRLTSTNITDTNEDAQNVGITTQTLASFNPAASISLPPFSMNVLTWSVAGATSVPPAIVTPAQGQTVAAGASASFTVGASGGAPLSYQWQKNGAAISGATGTTLTLNNVQPSDAGSYTVVISNAAGSVTSTTATLTVTFSRMINISTRGLIQAGGALTPGFVMRGAGAKRLVIRGIGPTLSGFGVSGALRDPRLEVIPIGGTTALVSNDDWGGGAALSIPFASVGAFALPAGSRDAAVQADLAVNQGGYTVRVTPAGPVGSGLALAEIYDADDDGSPARLINVSTLGFVGAGENALTAGFVIRGAAAKQVLIRAIGPGLATFGVGGLLADPQLAVIPAGQALAIASNNDWGGAVALRVAFAAAGAFGLADNSRDAAVIVSLPAGGYTVMVSGTGNTTGTALVEIYDLDP